MCLHKLLVTTSSPQDETIKLWKVMKVVGVDRKMVPPYRNVSGVSWGSMYNEEKALDADPGVKINTWLVRDGEHLLSTGYQTGFHCFLTESDARKFGQTIVEDTCCDFDELVVVQVYGREVRSVGLQGGMTVVVVDEIYFNHQPSQHSHLRNEDVEDEG